MLEKFPPKEEKDSVAQIDAPEPDIQKKRVSAIPHEYPPELGFVLDGMAYVYVRSGIHNPKNYLRVLHTPFSAQGHRHKGGFKQPQFHVHEKGDQLDSVYVCDRILPIEDKEFTWLEAFIKICRYMSTMQEIWAGKEKMTVAEYWKLHVTG